MTDVLSRDEIRRRVDALGPWFHNLDLNGVSTAPTHFLGDYPRVKWRRFAGVIPDSLKGMTVLDIGCNAGFYAMEMKRRGAERIYEDLKDKSIEEQIAYWQQKNEEFRRFIDSVREKHRAA